MKKYLLSNVDSIRFLSLSLSFSETSTIQNSILHQNYVSHL